MWSSWRVISPVPPLILLYSIVVQFVTWIQLAFHTKPNLVVMFIAIHACGISCNNNKHEDNGSIEHILRQETTTLQVIVESAMKSLHHVSQLQTPPRTPKSPILQQIET